MAIAYVNGSMPIDGGSGSSKVFNITWTTVSGNALICAVFWKDDFTISSVAHSGGGANFVDCGAGRLTRPTDGYLQVFGKPNITGGASQTVTITWSSTVTSIEVGVFEYSGAHASSLFTGFGTGTATSGSSVTTSSFNPNASGTAAMVCAFAAGNAADTATVGNIDGSAATMRAAPTNYGEGFEDRIASFGSSITAAMNLTPSLTKAGIVAAGVAEAAAGGGAVLLGQILL